MILRIVFLGVALLALSSCVTTKEDFHETLSSWVGSSEEELVDEFGLPTNFYERDGKRYLKWADISQAVLVGEPTTYTIYGKDGAAHTYPGLAPISGNSNCVILWIIEDDVVSAWRYEDNSCY